MFEVGKSEIPLYQRINNILNNGSMDIEELKEKINQNLFKTITEKELLEELYNNPNLFFFTDGLISSTNNQSIRDIGNFIRHIHEIIKPYINPNNSTFTYKLLFFKRYFDTHQSQFYNNIFLKNNPNSHVLIPTIEESITKLSTSFQFPINFINDFINQLRILNAGLLFNIFHNFKIFDTSYYPDREFNSLIRSIIKIDNFGFEESTNSLERLMVSLLNINQDTVIFDPYGDEGKFLLTALNHKNFNLRGEYRENNLSYDKAYINFSLNNHNVNLSSLNYFQESQNNKSYEYIITKLPLNVQLIFSEQTILLQEAIDISNAKDSLTVNIAFIMSKLSSHGKAVILAPISILSDSKQRDLREYLIENNYIDAIISLNKSSLNLILVLNKNKVSKNSIKFINASFLSINQYYFIANNILDIEETLNGYKNETKHSILIDNQMIIDNDYELNANFYKKEMIELINLKNSGKARKLKSLVQIRISILDNILNPLIDNGIPLIGIKDLQSDILDLYIPSVNSLEKISDEQKDSLKIKEDAILISRTGEPKPTIFKPTEDIPYIFIDKNIFALIIKPKIISIEYLYYQLYSKLFLEQVKINNSDIYNMYKKTAEKILIPYLSLDSQTKYVKTQKANIISQERATLEAKLKLMEYKEDIKAKESDIVRVLVHQLRPNLIDIYAETEELQKVIKIHNLGHYTKKNNNDFDVDFDKPTNYTLEEISNNLYNISKKLSDSLTLIEKIINFKSIKFSKNNINLFFKKYIASKEIKIKNKYKIKLKCIDINVEFNTNSFTELLDQLLLNAEKHAFTEEKKYIIEFNIKTNKQKNILIIEYKNNGKRFLISKDEYIGAFVKGQFSNGSGIGGFYIDRIIKAHRGDLSIEEQEEGFCLKIKIPLEQK